MFTSEPSQTQRIERMIRDTRIVDPRSRVRCDRPSAPDLAALMSGHGIPTELLSVGMPRADLDPSLPPDERVRRAIPFLRRMRNTATSWCFYRILRDLYDVHDPNLTESNYRDVLDRVQSSGRDPAWPGEVLGRRCNIETLVTGLGHRSADPTRNPPNVRFMLDARDLFCPGVATDSGYYEALATLLGDRPTTPAALARGLRDWLDATVRGDVRFTGTVLSIEARFDPPDEGATARVLARAASGGDLDDEDVATLARSVSWSILGWHHENRKAFQIAVGAEPSLRDVESLPRPRETWTSEMARVFRRFSGARFDLMMASDALSREAAILARQLPNVYVSGDWWHDSSPPTIETNVAMRLQVAPMTKVGGFLCDAHYVEWTYGKLQVVTKAMASAFAHLIESGYYEEEDVPPILAQILRDTPRDLYDLAP